MLNVLNNYKKCIAVFTVSIFFCFLNVSLLVAISLGASAGYYASRISGEIFTFNEVVFPFITALMLNLVFFAVMNLVW